MAKNKEKTAGVINYKNYHQNSSRQHFPINKEDLISYKDNIVKKNLSSDTFKQYMRHIKKYHIAVKGSWDYGEFDPIINDALNKLKNRSRSIGTSTQSAQQQVSPLSGLPSVSSTQSAQQQASLMGGQPSINEIQGTSTQPVQQQASPLLSSQPSINDIQSTFSSTQSVQQPSSLLSGQSSINNIQSTFQSGQGPYVPLNYPWQYIPFKDLLQFTVPTQLGQMSDQVSFQDPSSTTFIAHTFPSQFDDNYNVLSTQQMPFQIENTINHVQELKTRLNQKAQQINNQFNQEIQQLNDNFKQEVLQLINRKVQELNDRINQEIQEFNNDLNNV
ncbi:hypothetical protein F8M41_026030 [Gigaspora margarita]|uniref:Uncharacterized protein n=1 Tax=Gigaspora margarita TaxID=4874 RepID=A0A8H4ABC4_GIGMA|nr:hypothetical protein F8M41_026030 [Gigaspora margarita]